MRRVIGRVQEAVFRTLGMLSALSFRLHELRLGIPLSWLAAALLFFGILQSVTGGWQTFLCYRPPMRRIHEISQVPLTELRYVQVPGWAYRDTGYERYIEGERKPWDLVLNREVLESYYLLLDHDTGMGILVQTEGPIPQRHDPLPTVVAGELSTMRQDLQSEVTGDDWGEYGIVLLDRVLMKAEQRFPLRELITLLLCLQTLAFLVLSPRFDYIIFRAEPTETSGPPPDPEIDPFGNVDLRLTALLPVLGARRRVQLVEASARTQPVENGWQFRVYDDKFGLLSIPLPRDSIEQMTLGRVYFGRYPRWGVWLLYRDTHGARRRLCLSFSDPVPRQAVVEALTGKGDAPPASPTSSEGIS